MKRINFLSIGSIILLTITICTSCAMYIPTESSGSNSTDESSIKASESSLNTTSQSVGINIGNDEVNLNVPGLDINVGNDGVTINGIDMNNYMSNNFNNVNNINVTNFILSRDIFNKTLDINTFKSTLAYSEELNTTNPNAQDIVINAAGVFIVFEKSNDDLMHFTISTTTESEFLKYDFSLQETGSNVVINAKPKSNEMKNLNNNRLLTIALPDKKLNSMLMNLAFTL
ncbi:MAG: hypothetical protein FWC47_07655 [Oscillospiraceae bacterium]|nr:hypothetical protein [Oscillospiraceae bacterium]